MTSGVIAGPMPAPPQSTCHDLRRRHAGSSCSGHSAGRLRPTATPRCSIRRRGGRRRRGRRSGVTGARGDRAYPAADAGPLHRHEALPSTRQFRCSSTRQPWARSTAIDGSLGRRLSRAPEGEAGSIAAAASTTRRRSSAPCEPDMARLPHLQRSSAPTLRAPCRPYARTHRSRCPSRPARAIESPDQQRSRSRLRDLAVISPVRRSKPSTGPATTRSPSSNGDAAMCWARDMRRS